MQHDGVRSFAVGAKKVKEIKTDDKIRTFVIDGWLGSPEYVCVGEYFIMKCVYEEFGPGCFA